MASVNKVILIGHLGKDPETRFMPSGDAVTNFSIATSETWKDKATGDKKEATEWHRISTFGKLAEICGEYLKKGSQVYVEGKIQTKKWQDKQGNDRYSTEIKADQMRMLGGKPDGQDRESGERSSGASASEYQKAKDGGAPAKTSGGTFADMDDDIPFAPIGRCIAGHAI